MGSVGTMFPRDLHILRLLFRSSVVSHGSTTQRPIERFSKRSFLEGEVTICMDGISRRFLSILFIKIPTYSS